jgi:hypothetical protein
MIATAAVACSRDKNAGTTTPATSAEPTGGVGGSADPGMGGLGSNGPATAGGASTQNSVYGGNTGSGSAPGDRFTNERIDPATGMTADAGVDDAGGAR